MDRHCVGGLVGFDIDLREIWEFLALAGLDVERQRAGGEAVLAQRADGAEIGRAEKSDPVVPAPVERPVFGLLHAEAREARP